MDADSFLASFDGEPGYLDWAAFGPLSPAVRSEALAAVEQLGSGRRAAMDLVGAHVDEARDLLAELLDTDAAQVVLQPSSTYGLMPGKDAPRASMSSPPAQLPTQCRSISLRICGLK